MPRQQQTARDGNGDEDGWVGYGGGGFEEEKPRCRANFPSFSRIDDSVKIRIVAALLLHPSSKKMYSVSFFFFVTVFFLLPAFIPVYQFVYKFAFILTYLVAGPRLS